MASDPDAGSEGSSSGAFLFSGRFRATPDLLRQASRHLGTAALQYAVVLGLAWFAVRTFQMRYRLVGVPAPDGAASAWLHLGDGLVAGAVGISGVVAVLGRQGRIARGGVFDIAVAYQVVGALGIAVAEVWGPFAPGTGLRGIPWVCAWILVYPLVVPMPVGRTILAAAGSVAAIPAAVWFTVLVGQNPAPEARVLAQLLLPALLLGAVASFPARLVLPSLQAAEGAVGSYRLVRLIGRGGMGEVWRADHAFLARPAAIKFIRPPALSDPTGRRAALVAGRFEQEARATAALTSPHTVALFDYGTTHDGHFYYAMELLDGIDLETLVAEHGPLDPARVVHLLRQAARSLAEAHARGMVHRDVKPANLIACRVGLQHDFLKVVDFGLVQLLDAPEGVSTRLTGPGHVAGTPMYMAPEAISGGAIGPAADLYALGCVAWWLLVGLPVYPDRAPAQVFYAQVSELLPPVSVRMRGPVPASLEALVMQCLCKDPAGRPESAEALDEALGEVELGEPWTQARARAWWEEHGPPERVPTVENLPRSPLETWVDDE